MKSMKYAILLAAVLSLSACGSLKLENLTSFQNRVVMTLAEDEMSVNSKWGIFGITTPIANQDKDKILELIRGKKQ